MIEVIRNTTWMWGANNCSYGGQIGQVTHCRLNDIEFYVRENINGISSFFISAGERQADKVGTSKVRKERQCLELLAPKEHWDKIAEAVGVADKLKRPVNKSRNFNQKFVQEIFKA